MEAVEKLYVLQWNYGKSSGLVPPYEQNNPKMIPDFPHGRFMVYSREIAEETAASHNKQYGSPDKQVEIIPLVKFLASKK